MKNICVMGIITENPELIKLEHENSQPQLNFMLSVRDKIFKRNKFELIEICCRGRLIEAAQNNFKKGNTVIINGHPLVKLQPDLSPIQRIYAHNIEFITPYKSISIEFTE